jgi:hypothetical protein
VLLPSALGQIPTSLLHQSLNGLPIHLKGRKKPHQFYFCRSVELTYICASGEHSPSSYIKLSNHQTFFVFLLNSFLLNYRKKLTGCESGITQHKLQQFNHVIFKVLL